MNRSYLYFILFSVFTIIKCSLYLWERRKSSELKSCVFDNNCFNITVKAFNNGDWQFGVSIKLSNEECSLTLDLSEIICPKLGIDPSCFLYSSVGTRTNTCYDLIADSNVFVVPPGKLFILPSLGVGYKAELNHISKIEDNKPIIIETLSVYPKIFKLRNFFTSNEADQLKSIESSNFRPSQLNNKYCTNDAVMDVHSQLAFNIKRRAFDVLGLFPYDETLADGLMVLRYNTTSAFAPHYDYIYTDLYLSGSTDSENNVDSNNYKQTNNTNNNTCSNSNDNKNNEFYSSNNDANTTCKHTNSSCSNPVDHDYDSSRSGTNRFATIILFLNDVEEGGDIVFSDLDAPEPNSIIETPVEFDSKFTEVDPCWSLDVGTCAPFYQVPYKHTPVSTLQGDRSTSPHNIASKAITDFDVSENINDNISTKEEDTWQSVMSNTLCKNKFKIKPKRLEALIIYLQNPDGSHNLLTKHGTCPVIQGIKFEANLWIWNGPRVGYSKSEQNGHPKPISASFESKDIQNVELYWEDTYWDSLVPGRSLKVNTFSGHQWSIRRHNKILKTWIIDSTKKSQRFIVSSEDFY